jgi:hypothetical protein
VGINLVTLCGQQVPTLSHMLQHYRGLVDNIYVIVYSLGEHDPIGERVRAVVEDFGVDVYRTVVAEHFDPAFATQLYNEAMMERPDDWWIIADPDEFQLYFNDLRAVVDECEAHGWSFVGGHFLDRFGVGGTLPEIGPTSLWRQFPIAGVTRSLVTNRREGTWAGWAPSWKICLARGSVRLAPGQHAVLKQDGVVGYPLKRGLVQVHHFKWDSTVLDRHLSTLDTLKRVSKAGRETVRTSYQTMYDHLVAHGGKVDVTDRRGMFAECPEPLFSAYPHWSKIMRQAPPFGLEVDLASPTSLKALQLWRRPVLGRLFWWLSRLRGRKG